MGLNKPATQYSLHDGIVELRLHTGRPGNGLHRAAIDELCGLVARARSDSRCFLVVLVSGHDDFCTGFDVDSWTDIDVATVRATCEQFWNCMEGIARSPKPVVACLRGRVMGGGLGIAAACDLVLADRGTVFQLPELLLGMVPALIAPFLLRRISLSRMASLALSSRIVTAVEAREVGLVDEVADADLEASLARQTKRLLRASPTAVAEFKGLLAAWEGVEFTARKREALAWAERWLTSPDVVESLRDWAQSSTPRRVVGDDPVKDLEA